MADTKKLNWAEDDDEGPGPGTAKGEKKLGSVTAAAPTPSETTSAGSELLDDDTPLPPPETTVVGDIKKVVTYSRDEKTNKLTKTTRTFRLEKRKTRISKAVLARRELSKFGVSKGLPAGPDSASTNQVLDDIFLTLSSKKEVKDDAEDEDPLAKLRGNSVVKCRYCGGDHWSTKCPYKDNLTVTRPDGAAPLNPDGTVAEEGDPGFVPPAAGGPTTGGVNEGGRYVPPSQRAGRSGGGTSMNDRDDSNTIRVTNLSENTREDDLRDLFRHYGSISRCYLATDRETGAARGFAFISFHRREDAANAIEGVNGHGYDHLILQVDWAEDRKDGDKPQRSGGY